MLYTHSLIYTYFTVVFVLLRCSVLHCIVLYLYHLKAYTHYKQTIKKKNSNLNVEHLANISCTRLVLI